VFTGVCIDTASGTGFCAEAAAIAAVVTAGELKIRRIVAVWKDDTGALYVLSPCGRCREFIHQMHRENIETEVVLARDRVVPLRDLLPEPSLFTPAGKSENSRVP
jgi:cytidine deaminase